MSDQQPQRPPRIGHGQQPARPARRIDSLHSSPLRNIERIYPDLSEYISQGEYDDETNRADALSELETISASEGTMATLSADEGPGSQASVSTEEAEPESPNVIREELAAARNADEADRELTDALDRFARDRARQAARREAETPEAREFRLAGVRERFHRRRQPILDVITNAGFSYDQLIDYASHSSVTIGELNRQCQFCRALCFQGEAAGICCCSGKVGLTPFEHPPPEYMSMFDGVDPRSDHFLSSIRKYNSLFQMTSFGVKGETNESLWSTFKIQGQIYHQMGAFFPHADQTPKFMQIFFLGGSEAQVDFRANMFRDVNRAWVQLFQSLFDEHNSLIRTFKTAIQQMPSDRHALRIRGDLAPAGEHRGRFNAPTVEDVAVVMIEGDYPGRDIVIRRRDRIGPDGQPEFQKIYESHPLYDALQYPMIFWRGNYTYSFDLRQVDPVSRLPTSAKLTMMSFYAHQLMVRDDENNFIFKCRALLNQFVVDMYAKIEAERLRYIRLHQDNLRVSEYIHLRDAIEVDGNAENIGQRFILPSSYIGSPRHMHEYAQDAMAYVRSFGRPDLFITFTCNPNWPEISALLFPGQKSTDRHDIVARVFRQKHMKLIDVITKYHLFGPVRCHMYVIEWQKRGLPHSHTLIWLSNRIRPEQIDDIISAELPHPDQDQSLYNVISKHMIHGPCGREILTSKCLDANKNCTKHYPRAFRSETMTGEDGYPLYRRRRPEDGGYSYALNSGLTIDNSWVVPHNRVLSKMFNAHLNVEYCNSVKSIKYLCKYVSKGSDMAILGIERPDNTNDEITLYQLGRYISTNEAFWRIFGFPIHARDPMVQKLAVHLENGQRVFFNSENAPARAQDPPKTTLTEFFSLCSMDEFARTLLYVDVPKYFTWNASSKSWARRKQGTPVPGHLGVKQSNAIGRVYVVHPTQKECFYLRILLHHVRGPTSFASLRTVDRTECQTFQAACLRRGLLESDSQWGDALSNAAATKVPGQMRHLFAIILTQCSPADPTSLWERFKHDLSEDLYVDRRRNLHDLNEEDFEMYFNQALVLIEDICLRIDGRLLSQLNMPSPNRDFIDSSNSEITRERSYDRAALRRFTSSNIPRLVADQKNAFETIIRAITLGEGGFFFLDAPGGTGKTFLLNLILAERRQEGSIILAVASTGIAATLLDGGRTAHSAFKLPLKYVTDAPMCNIGRGTAKAQMLQRCEAIIWDECTMSHKKSLEALDRTLRDLRNCDTLFGGIVVILAGDFRQTLPIVVRGTPADELNACLKASSLWRHVSTLRLETNMRVRMTGENASAVFATQLLQIGNGTMLRGAQSGDISFPSGFCHRVLSQAALIDQVFPDLLQNFANRDWLSLRALLAPTNVVVDQLNDAIQDKITDRPTRFYRSIDKTVDDDQALYYTPEFLNSLQPSGFPPHLLGLKVGSPIIVLRNLNPPKLCNGTKLCVKGLYNNLIKATIAVGIHKGEDVLIPRIPLISSDLIVDFKRLQFPVRLAFAMTINKSQGQSLGTVGLCLEEACFSHGQLYVACSRVGSPSHLFVLAPEGRTKNIVYPQALR